MPLFSVYHHDNEADLFSMECTTGVLNTALVQLVQPAGSGPRMTPTPTPASATNDNVTPPTTFGSNHAINATEASTTALLSSYPLAATAIRPSAPCGYQRMELLPLSFVTDLLSSSKVVAALQTCAAAALSTPPLGAANATLSPGGTSGRNSFGNRSSSVTNGANANNGTTTTGGGTNNNNNTSMTTIGANSSSAVMATLQSVLHNIPFVGLLLAPVQLSVAELSGLVVNGTYILLGCREASPHATHVQSTHNDNNNASIPLPLMSHGGLAVLETAHAAQGTATQDGSGPVVGMDNDGGEEENNKAGKRTKNGTMLPNTDNETLNLSTRNALPSTTPLPPRKLSELLSEARTIGAMLSPETAGYTTTSNSSRTSPHTNNTNGSNMTCSYTCLSTGPGPAMMAAAAMVCSNTGGGSAPNSAAGANSARSNNNNANTSGNSHGHGGAGGAGGHEDAFSYGPARLVTQPLPQPTSTPHATITTPNGQSEGVSQEGGAVQNEAAATAGKETRTDGSPARSTDAEVTAHGTSAGRAGKSGNASGGRRTNNNAGGASSEKSTPRTGQDNTNTSSNRERSPSSGAANTNPIGGSGTHALRSVGLTGLAEEGDFGPVPLSQAASALLSTSSSSASPTSTATGPGAPPLVVNMNTAAVTGRFPSGGLGQNGLDGPLLHSLQQPHLIERMISLDVLWRGPRGEHDLLQALLNEYVKMMKGKVEAVRMQWMTTYNNARTATAGAVEGRKKRGKK